MTKTKEEENLSHLNSCQPLFKRSWKQAKEEGIAEELTIKELCRGFFMNGYLEAMAKIEDDKELIDNEEEEQNVPGI